MAGRTRWQFSDGAALALVVAAAVGAAWPIWSRIAQIGIRDPENSHVLLALPVAILLTYLRRGRVRQLSLRHDYAGPLAVLLALVMIEAGRRIGYEVLMHLGALAMVLGAAASVVGWRVLLRFKPSLMALVFLMPVPGRMRTLIAQPLQDASAKAVQFVMDLAAVPIVRSGNALQVNGVDVTIAEACNGMRMVSALALITLAFAFSVPMRSSVRLVFLLLSPVIALAVNIIRLIPTVLFFGYSDVDTATLVHDASGWAVLLIAIGLLYGVLSLMRWLEIPIEPFPVHRSG